MKQFSRTRATLNALFEVTAVAALFADGVDAVVLDRVAAVGAHAALASPAFNGSSSLRSERAVVGLATRLLRLSFFLKPSRIEGITKKGKGEKTMPGHPDDRIWCEGCARMQPWTHKHNPTPKAKIASRLIRLLRKVEAAVENWRDTDQQPSYYVDLDPFHRDYDSRRHVGHPNFDVKVAVSPYPSRERSN